MSILGRLLRIARAAVSSVVRMVTQAVNQVMESVTRPLQGMVQQVLGGIWKGEGAQRFAEEMTSQVIPQLMNLTMSFSNTASYINRALDTMTRADKQAQKLASGLVDVFKSIYH